MATQLSTNNQPNGRNFETELLIDKTYIGTFPGRLKICHIVLGAIYSGLLLNWGAINLVLSFGFVGLAFAFGSLISLISSLVVWGADGKIIMARINFIYNTAATVMLIISIMTLTVFLLTRLITHHNFFVHEQTFSIVLIVALLFGSANTFLYYYSARMVRRSKLDY